VRNARCFAAPRATARMFVAKAGERARMNHIFVAVIRAPTPC